MKRILAVLPVFLLASIAPAQVVDDIPEDVLLSLQAGPGPMAMGVAAGERGFLGVGVKDIGAERAKELKLSDVRGVEVTHVTDGSPAEKAGLRDGDVVLEFNGERVDGVEEFVRLVRETPPGREAKILASRDGKTMTVTARLERGRSARVYGPGPEFERQMEKLGDRLRDFQVQVDLPRVFMSWQSGALGADAESLTPQLAEYFGVKEGVLVRSVNEGSAAEKAGLKAGDVIIRMDGKDVDSPRDITEAVREDRSKTTFPLTVVRNRQEMTLNVTIERRGATYFDRPGPAPIVTPQPAPAPRPPKPPRPPQQYFTPPVAL